MGRAAAAQSSELVQGATGYILEPTIRQNTQLEEENDPACRLLARDAEARSLDKYPYLVSRINIPSASPARHKMTLSLPWYAHNATTSMVQLEFAANSDT